LTTADLDRREVQTALIILKASRNSSKDLLSLLDAYFLISSYLIDAPNLTRAKLADLRTAMITVNASKDDARVFAFDMKSLVSRMAIRITTLGQLRDVLDTFCRDYSPSDGVVRDEEPDIWPLFGLLFDEVRGRMPSRESLLPLWILVRYVLANPAEALKTGWVNRQIDDFIQRAAPDVVDFFKTAARQDTPAVREQLQTRLDLRSRSQGQPQRAPHEDRR